MRTFEGLSELRQATGEELGVTPWLSIDQDRVNRFAEVSEDRQWIHVDEEAAKDGPYGGTVAHGFLTLSLVPHLLHQLYRVNNVRMAINYGLDKVRFPAVARVGSRIRGVAQVAEVVEMSAAVQASFRISIHAEGVDKPICAAIYIVRFIE